ncbi:molybdopterin-synthase adenylyltransferase MoeB [Psychromicrobium lacuslunae]|uniref:Molybdopterin biosynthesis-like protein MoeZ n=1 Tax=Psychromicrobium lacuslunae TaxID=1618207 RepID=A0A0D4BYN7_9MICC|nr:molybdopterin-synthase adenylyltransferase MoeB [Psychromicrobium lacuslunae]AJT41537.1 molybdopterin biosynthesis-like protein MoeZ [Psychromicrobium lacuslunae]
MSFALSPLVAPGPELSAEELQRYSRHLLLPEVAVLGQRRLKNSRVLVIGAGGLGSPVISYLAAAGVGIIGVIDDDVVDVSNLQRQVLHKNSSVGQPKVSSAVAAVAELNPLVTVQAIQERLSSANALDLLGQYDLVLDGSDNFATRYLVSDACEILAKPLVWGSILRFDGQVSVFWSGQGPSYRDVFPEPPPADAVPSCSEAGVFGLLCGVIGSVMAGEAVKLLTGIGEPLLGRLQVYDALDSSWRTVRVSADPERSPVTELIDYQEFCGVQPAASVAIPWSAVTPTQQLIDVRSANETALGSLPGAIVIPKAVLDAKDYSLLPEDTELVLFCRTGLRSAAAALALRAAGFERVWSVAGGLGSAAGHAEVRS